MPRQREARKKLVEEMKQCAAQGEKGLDDCQWENSKEMVTAYINDRSELSCLYVMPED